MLPRLEEDLFALLLACVEERLPERAARLSAKTALSVVLAAKGYPGAPVRGSEIHGVERAAAMPFVAITHAGPSAKAKSLSPMAAASSMSQALAPMWGTRARGLMRRSK